MRKGNGVEIDGIRILSFSLVSQDSIRIINYDHFLVKNPDPFHFHIETLFIIVKLGGRLEESCRGKGRVFLFALEGGWTHDLFNSDREGLVLDITSQRRYFSLVRGYGWMGKCHEMFCFLFACMN